MSSVFTSKLHSLGETIALATDADHRQLAAAMRACSTRPVLAVGSGGSAVAAEFLAACRVGLGHPLTAVVTPMAYVLKAVGLPAMNTWLFSASGENQDILAALDAARNDDGAEVDIVTSNPKGTLATVAMDALGHQRNPAPRLHLAPVADPKDSFLTTHSLVAAVTSLIFAADLLTGAVTHAERSVQLLDAAARSLSAEARTNLRLGQLGGLADRDTLVLLHDPHLAAAAMLIETSFWEAGICAVQRTDFRNFAHGRHVWLVRHPQRTFIFALTSERTLPTWAGIQRELPEQIPIAHLDFGRVGRCALFEAILSSLAVVEAAGALKGVDPGRPGVAEFGRRVFDRSDLSVVRSQDDVSTWRKRRAEIRIDPPGREPTDWPQQRDRFVSQLANAEIRALILDYDGTMVGTPDRLNPPRADLLDALIELGDHGVLLGFATGRGGSVGEVLRADVPARLHRAIHVGYYNGAHVVPLEIDIRRHPPEPDAIIAAIHARLCAEEGLFVEGWAPKGGPLLISIPFEKLAARERGVERVIAILDLFARDDAGIGAARILSSGHSLDVVPAWASKFRVVEMVHRILGDAEAAVLRVGDSGDCQGNDYELLGGALGLSVDRVCHRHGSCWNPLPPGVSGPDGLARILLAIRPLRYGVVNIDASGLFTT